jgi:NAD(P)-dependent dehydrogenase (short-subunit alcohol dehydrogenase family)
VFSHLDLLDKSTVAATHKLAEDTFGPVNVLVNCAGLLRNGGFLEQDDNDFDIVISTNLRGTVWTMQEFIPSMVEQGGGSIVNLSSISAIWPESGAYFYGASKAAVAKLTTDVAREFAKKKVRVNTIMPGPTDTPLMPSFVRENPDLLDEIIEKQAVLGRLCRPEDIALGAVYLASDESVMMSGQRLVIDAGVTLSN